MKDRILNILEENDRAYTVFELKDILGLDTTSEMENMLKVLGELESSLIIYHTNKDKYMAFKYSHLKKGKIDVSDKGFGFVLMEDEEDIHVDKEHLNGAQDGDMVIVEITNKNTGAKKEGRVLRIAKRSYGPIVGEYSFNNGSNADFCYYVLTTEGNINNNVLTLNKSHIAERMVEVKAIL